MEFFLHFLVFFLVLVAVLSVYGFSIIFVVTAFVVVSLVGATFLVSVVVAAFLGSSFFG